MSEDKARRQAFLLLDDVIQNKKYANLTLKNSLDGFDSRDRAFISALVYGTLDKLISIDYIISLYAKGKIQTKVRNLIRMGVYQIVYMDKVPDSAAVSTTVELAQRIGKGMLKGYINGVLRTVSREKNNIKYPQEPEKYIAAKYSYPEFFVKELIEEWGKDEAEAFCKFDEAHRTSLRVDRSKADPKEIKAQLQGEDSLFFDDCFYITGEPRMLENGVCSVQSEASMAAVRALAPEKNERILDACAAPGGKTVYAASLMQEGEIVALDKHLNRVKLIESNVKRCGYEKIVSAMQADMTEKQDLGTFDRILVDAPCSGMGVLGQKPEIKNTVTPEGFWEIEEIQRKILFSACDMLKKGGVLVYSTCTVRKQENIKVIQDFLKARPDFRLSSLKGLLGENLEKICDVEKGYVELYPHKHGTDGFFIARLEKN